MNLAVDELETIHRLDLGRIGIRPEAERLCTQAARQADFIAWAYRRSLE